MLSLPQERGGWDLLECLVKRAAQYHLQLTFCEDWLVGLVGGGEWLDEGKLGSIKQKVSNTNTGCFKPRGIFLKGVWMKHIKNDSDGYNPRNGNVHSDIPKRRAEYQGSSDKGPI